MESSTSMDTSAYLCNGVTVQYSSDADENDNLDVDIVKNLDSYFEDIEDKLIVSRNVSDWVTRGAISAVEQDATEKIAKKDLELKRLKETIPLYHVGSDGNESVRYTMKYDYPNREVDHYKTPDSLKGLHLAAKEQLKKLKKEMEKIEGSLSKRADVDKVLGSLETTLEDMCVQSEAVVCSSNSSHFEREQDMEFELEIERTVFENSIRSLQEEFEQRLWDQSSQSYGSDSATWIEWIKEISSLRQELCAMSKLISFSESGHLHSHGSLEHRNGSGDHFSAVSVWEENGDHDESMVVSAPESLEHIQLKDSSMEGLFNHFKAEMSKMKRQHELELQVQTEKYFSLKRALFFKEPGLHIKKDKELDSFKKRIPEAILQLDNTLSNVEKLPPFSNPGNSLDSLKDRLESILLENQQLRDSVMDEMKEIKCLRSQVSDAFEQISQHSLAQETLSKKVSNLECVAEDVQIEALVHQDLYRFLMREVLTKMEGLNEESIMDYEMISAVYLNMLKNASVNAAIVKKQEAEDSVRESLKELEERVAIWNQKYIEETQVRIALEMQALEKENSLKLAIAEKAKLEQENALLRAMVDEKAKLLQEAAGMLVKEKEKIELASQELERLRIHSTQQEILITKNDAELQFVKNDLAKAVEKVEEDRKQISELSEKLDIALQNLSEAEEEKNSLKSMSQNYQNALSSVEAREAEHMNLMKSTLFLVQELSKTMTAFECRTAEDIKMKSLRLGNLSAELGSLIQKANKLKKTGLQYKQKLEKRSSDLQKAEAEVDLLGDEVDALLSLLEKVYIALDHYSPILQHYPGVMEILKLVKRELSGESVKTI